MCQITSRPYADPRAVELGLDSYAQGGLSRVSYARPGKLFTANAHIITRHAGLLKREPLRAVVDAVMDLLRYSVPA